MAPTPKENNQQVLTLCVHQSPQGLQMRELRLNFLKVATLPTSGSQLCGHPCPMPSPTWSPSTTPMGLEHLGTFRYTHVHTHLPPLSTCPYPPAPITLNPVTKSRENAHQL